MRGNSESETSSEHVAIRGSAVQHSGKRTLDALSETATRPLQCRQCRRRRIFYLVFSLLISAGYIRIMAHVSSYSSKISSANSMTFQNINITHDSCTFRDYAVPSLEDNKKGKKGKQQQRDRIYGLSLDDYPPPFLRSAHYIFGEPPRLLRESRVLGKVCDQQPKSHPADQRSVSKQEKTRKTKRPISDGTNPSFISIDRILQERDQESLSPTLLALIRLKQALPSATYIVSLTFKSVHQCEYVSIKASQKTASSRPQYRKHQKEVDILIADQNMNTMFQSFIWKGRNVTGPRKPKPNATSSLPSGGEDDDHLAADDGRLLWHDGSLWLTYKQYNDDGGSGSMLFLGKLALHYDFNQTSEKDEKNETRKEKIEHTFRVSVVEQRYMCCGRNFAALPDFSTTTATKTQLSFLTWPDPIWVETVDTQQSSHYYPLDSPPSKSYNEAGERSGYHGTSAFLLHLPEHNEYLGIGHIHRERKWSKHKRQDAMFGHHYTHSFFTISQEQGRYQLKRLSHEFVFPSQIPSFTSTDGDIIQFATGLEWAYYGNTKGDDQSNKQLVIGYGINDCEGASVLVDWSAVNGMLRPVESFGKEVVHTMSNMTRDVFVARSKELNAAW